MLGGLCILAIKAKNGLGGQCVEFFLKDDLEFLKEKFPETSYILKEYSQSERAKALEFANATEVKNIKDFKEKPKTCEILGTFYLRGIQTPLELMQEEELRAEGTPEYCCEVFDRNLKRKVLENDSTYMFEFGGFRIRTTDIVAYNFSVI